jgi:hypothetical protein
MEIIWQNLVTKTINLGVMMDSDADAEHKHLSEVPKSTQLSIIRDQKSKIRDSNNKGIKLRDNLLQVTVRDSIIIFDISTDLPPQEIFYFNASH